MSLRAAACLERRFSTSHAAKAVQFKQGTQTWFRDVTLSSTDRNGKLATIPIVVQFVNATLKMPSLRAIGERALGVHRDAWLPDFTTKKFRSSYEPSHAFIPRDGARSKGKVALFSTCYVNYHEPGIAHDLLKVLNHNQIPYVVVEREACCGMPKLELGDIESVVALARKNLPALAAHARNGYTIVAPVPSCTLMFRQEIPLLMPDDDDAQVVKAAMLDPFEYLMARHKDGLLNTAFSVPIGRISYHVPCHSRVQNIGQKAREVLEMVPDTTVATVERCAGHAGTWGVKAEFHLQAMKIGRPVFERLATTPADVVSSDCPLAIHHIKQGIANTSDRSHVSVLGSPAVAHPITLVRRAYGLPD
jgi:glycerol-3-phosphate dehydrogenase subunit C